MTAAPAPTLPPQPGRRRWSQLLALPAVTGIALELLAGAPDRGNLLVLALAAGTALVVRRPGWMVAVYGAVGVFGELREHDRGDAAQLAVLTALIAAGVLEAWLGRSSDRGAGLAAAGLSSRARAGTLQLDLLAAAGMLAVGLVPLALVLAAGVPAGVVGLGALSWAIGVGLVKVPLFHLVLEPLRARGVRAGALAACNGLLSAAGELGAAAAVLALLLPDLDAAGAIGFGLAPAAAEAVLIAAFCVLGSSPLHGTSFQAGGAEIEAALLSRWPRGGRVLAPVLERALTVPIHAGTRVLVWASLHGRPAAAVLAVAVFAVTDGWATYVMLRDGAPMRRLASLIAVVVAASLLAGAGAWLVL